MKAPNECSNIQEIRSAIDAIDREVIKALSDRFVYVRAAAKFKTSEASVKAAERFNAMLQQRRIWAEESGLNPDVVEKLYRDLVNYFINEELKHWQSNSKSKN
ncbi:isochorismate lyase [Gloeocapsopsis dulcis]|uniref:Isochorismate-pyruvate lyase n=1 Tax=Gloeocapsopsis dulcis AAB1 = 1H9 TaxID=1433147 RepID=A0A6N8FWN5_9CHRO|nr:isochorismate lyase [Gloeocapsopsis dulcis]MUL36557.1 isochorismate-pyruvate lyase [Gloeocapsopsis dulcis AAB1 = 1H9]WNN91848.1 isochorismate lyase [Gloeocapsopsis dulcis]